MENFEKMLLFVTISGPCSGLRFLKAIPEMHRIIHFATRAGMGLS